MSRPGRPVVTVDAETREVLKRYPSIKVAAIACDVPHGTMYIRCQRGAIPRQGRYYRFEDEFDPAESKGRQARRLTPPTRREVMCLAFFRSYEQDEGVPPTLAECAEFMGVSRERVSQHLRRLEAKGLMERGAQGKRKWKARV